MRGFTRVVFFGYCFLFSAVLTILFLSSFAGFLTMCRSIYPSLAKEVRELLVFFTLLHTMVEQGFRHGRFFSVFCRQHGNLHHIRRLGLASVLGHRLMIIISLFDKYKHKTEQLHLDFLLDFAYTAHVFAFYTSSPALNCTSFLNCT